MFLVRRSYFYRFSRIFLQKRNFVFYLAVPKGIVPRLRPVLSPWQLLSLCYVFEAVAEGLHVHTAILFGYMKLRY